MGMSPVAKRERAALEWHGVSESEIERISRLLSDDDLHTLFLAFHKAGYSSGLADGKHRAYDRVVFDRVDIGRDR